MSYPYDIPYMRNPKDGDYALQMLLSSNDWSLPLNYSRKISYLKGKMKAHRDQCTNLEEATYRIIDEDGNVYFTQTFKKGEKANSTTDYHCVKEKSSVKFDYEYSTYTVEGIGTLTLCELIDSKGNRLTDCSLYKYLYFVRLKNKIPDYVITARNLSYMAAFPPRSKEEFINTFGLGEKKYEICGEVFLDAIQSYMEYLKKQ